MTTSTEPGPASDHPAEVPLGPIVQVSLFIRDVDRAVAFYRDVLGLRHLLTVGTMAFFDVSGVRLYLHGCADEEWRPASYLYFRTDDITATYDALRDRGVETTGAPHLVHTDEASGTQEWMAFFTDPDGNTLAALSRVRA